MEEMAPEVQEIMKDLAEEIREILDEYVDKPLEETTADTIRRIMLRQLEDVGLTPTYVEVYPNGKQGEYTINFAVAEHWLFDDEEEEERE